MDYGNCNIHYTTDKQREENEPKYKENELYINCNCCIDDIIWSIFAIGFGNTHPSGAPVPINPTHSAKNAIDMFPITNRSEDIHSVISRHVETVVSLSHKKADTHINVNVEFGNEEGQIPIDEIARKAENLNLTKK